MEELKQGDRVEVIYVAGHDDLAPWGDGKIVRVGDKGTVISVGLKCYVEFDHIGRYDWTIKNLKNLSLKQHR